MYIDMEYLVGAVFMLFIIICVINFLSILKIKKRYRLFNLGTSNKNMEMIMEEYIHLVKSLKEKSISIEKRINKIENDILNNIQKVGIKKYNAFNDMSSNLSFSIALLDAHNTGIIITELYLRNSSTIYVREIKNGVSDIRLSEEELEAIESAKKYMIKK